MWAKTFGIAHPSHAGWKFILRYRNPIAFFLPLGFIKSSIEPMQITIPNSEKGAMKCSPSPPYDAILQINENKADHELEETVKKISFKLGFDYHHYIGYFTIDRNNRTTRTISNYPIELQKKYTHQSRERIDPIIHHANTRLTPIAWSDLTHLSAEHRQFMIEMKEFGLGNGISFPIHTRNGDLGILSFACAVDRMDISDTIHCSLAYGVLSATLLHDVMRQIVWKSQSILYNSLTQRELECLRWVAKGKSNWEISVILGISVHGVVHHVRNFMSKFDVSSRHDAVARAAACGLI